MRVAGLVLAFGALAPAETTYTRDVAPIMQAKCQQCHRPNDFAPCLLALAAGRKSDIIVQCAMRLLS